MEPHARYVKNLNQSALHAQEKNRKISKNSPPNGGEQMSKFPAIQFYPGDWQKDPGIRSLGYFERGVWFELLLLMFESEERGVLILNGLPMTEDQIARSLGLDKQNTTTTLTSLLTSGVASRRDSDGAIFSRRMVRDEAIRQERIKAGKSGGNPNLLKQNPTTRDKQKPTPSSSSSVSSSSIRNNPLTPLQGDGEENPEDEIETPKKPKRVKAKTVDEQMAALRFPVRWGDQAKAAMRTWIKYRHDLKKPLVEQTLQQLINSHEADPREFASKVEYTIGKGWQGLADRPPEARAGSGPAKARETENERQERILKNLGILEETQNGATTNEEVLGDSGDGVQILRPE